MNANVRIKFSADTSDVDKSLKSYATQSSKDGGSQYAKRLKDHEKYLGDVATLEKRTNKIIDGIEKERGELSTKYSKLSFKNLEKEYDTHHNKIRTLTKALSVFQLDDTKARIQQQLAAEKSLTKELDLEYRKRDEVNHKGEGSKNGILGTGRNLINSTGLGFGLLAGGGLAAAVGIALKQGVTDAANFESALIHLSNTTGISGEALDKLGEKLRKTAIAYNTELPDAVAATENILRSLGQEFVSNIAATNSATDSVLLLSKAQKITAEESSTILTGTLHQFGLAVGSADQQAESLKNIANVLAAASREGTAKMPQLAEGLKTAGIVAHNAGISLEETAAAIEVLNKNSVDGAEAGGKFALFITKISAGTPAMSHALERLGLSYDMINPEKVGLNKSIELLKEKLNGVGNPVNRMEILTQIFGQGARGAIKIAEALMQDSVALATTTQKITGTNAAQEQSNKTMESTAERFKHAKIEEENFAISLGQKLMPMLSGILSTANDLVDAFKKLFSPESYGKEQVANLIEKTRDETRGLATSLVAGKYFNKDVARKELVDYASQHLSHGNPLALTMEQQSQIVTEVNTILDQAISDKAISSAKPKKDNKFGADFKKSKKDVAQEAFDAAKAQNAVLKEIAINAAYDQFQIDHSELNFTRAKNAAEEEERQNNLAAVKNYYIAKGVVGKEALSKAIAIDKDGVAIITAGNEARDKLYQQDLTNYKAYQKYLFDQKNYANEIDYKLQTIEYDFRVKNYLEKEKLFDTVAARDKVKKIEQLDKEKKFNEELLAVITSPASKAYTAWYEQFFKPIDEDARKTGNVLEGMFSDIGKAAMKLLESKALEVLSESLFGKKKRDKERGEAVEFPLRSDLYKEALKPITGAQGETNESPALSPIDEALKVLFGNSFALGGYTGDGDSSKLAGMVHFGEYVISAETVKKLMAGETAKGGSLPYAQLNEGGGSESKDQTKIARHYKEMQDFMDKPEIAEGLSKGFNLDESLSELERRTTTLNALLGKGFGTTALRDWGNLKVGGSDADTAGGFDEIGRGGGLEQLHFESNIIAMLQGKRSPIAGITDSETTRKITMAQEEFGKADSPLTDSKADKKADGEIIGASIATTLLKTAGSAKKGNGITAAQGVGALGSILSVIPGLNIFGSILSAGAGLFADGGYTGGKPGEVRGIVHGDEHVFTSPQLNGLFAKIQNTGGSSANIEKAIARLNQPQVIPIIYDTFGAKLSADRVQANNKVRALG